MVQRVSTVAFEGIEARAVDVQVQVAPGIPALNVVGLPDKAESEARERGRSAMIASGLALPARGLICPATCGPEAAWASPEMEIIAAGSLIQLANHFKGTQVLSRPQPKVREADGTMLDLVEIKGQESAKRALEIAAAGGHNLLMVFCQVPMSGHRFSMVSRQGR